MLVVAVVVKGLLCIFNGDIGDDPCIIELELLDEDVAVVVVVVPVVIGVLIGFPCCEPEVMPPNVICDACSVNDFEF